MLNIALYNNAPFKEIFYQQHIIQASVERKYSSTYMYGWNSANYGENPYILIHANGIQNEIQTILKCVYLKKTNLAYCALKEY